MTGTELVTQVGRRMTLAMVGANALGAVVVFVFLSYLLPLPVPRADADRLQQVNTVAFLVLLPLSMVLGELLGGRASRPMRAWLLEESPLDERVRRNVLRQPLLLMWNAARLWSGAAVLFGLLNATYSPALGADVAATIALGGLTTSALSYLLAERIMRPVVTRAYLGSRDAPPVVLGVRRRLLLAWGVGTGVPLLGLAMGTFGHGSHPPLGRPAMLFLVAVAFVVGLMAISGAARAVADPVHSVAEALRGVGEGRLDVLVPVYDASEIGRLQAGFNAMVEGLRERATLQDLFGRQVGTDVARLALERGVRLGGERREVAVLFVDIIGSTGLAVSRDPEEVVAQLNAFFGVVVEAVGERGGWVNKFEGDAALCVFGAPVERPDAAACALAAARALRAGLTPLDLDAAIGVCAGSVVAGNIGTESRFEYTVIGDPVNTAARLAELAKTVPGRVLADGVAVDAAGEEAEQWQPGEEVVLRGRTTPTRLARPRTAAPT